MKKQSLFQRLLIILALVLSPVIVHVNAQELLPELAGPVAKHKAADEALDKQKTEAIAVATKPYLSALDGVEKSATAKGELEVVAAVVKEREAAAAGALDPELPAALPKMKLQGTRKTLLTKLEQLNVDFAKRKKLSDADYLRFLATLQTKAASNPELAKQLAAEKAALLTGGADAGSAGTANNVPRGKNVVVNGDFEKVVDGRPEGWSNANHMTVETENGNQFVRFEQKIANSDGSIGLSIICQNLVFSPGAKKVFISARLRTTGCVSVSKKAPSIPLVQILFRNKDGKTLYYVPVKWDGRNGPWRSIHGENTLSTEAVTAELQIVNGHCPGQIDFDNVEVSFK